MTKKKQYEELVRRYLENKASDKELEVIFDLLKKGELQPYFHVALEKEDHGQRASGDSERTPGDAQRAPDDAERAPPAIVVFPGRWQRLAIAAAVTGLLVMGSLWYFKTASGKSRAVAGIRYSGDVSPGRNHALLTLADGKVVDLDSNSAPVVSLQAGTRLVKNKAGEWVYHSPAGEASSIIYNTLSAPRGGQFPFVLEDGTRVWLNAASSLRFPVAFRGGAREVFLAGEAYFEVAPDAHKTFRVHIGDLQVQVLGTHFNVNAYSDESDIRTTLLEGSVKIIRDKTSALLHAGEQVSTKPDGTMNTVKDPEAVEAAMAWRDGFFNFNEDDIQTVMRQISRWYDVDIRYEGPVTKAVFGGDIGRDLTLVQVLKVLEKSQVHFRLEGNILTVLP